MQIKRNRGSELRTLLRPLGARRWLLALLSLLVLAVIVVGSIYYGMVLVKSGQSMTLNAWLRGLAESKLGVIPNFIDGLRANPERLEIDIAFTDVQKLAYKREQALQQGVLVSEDEDWVPATIRHNGDSYKVDLRLKGDLSDHWRRSDRWSYKIKVKGDNAILGMKRFAIQDPQTREYLNEWLIQKLLAELDLISLHFDFVDVTINGKHQPVYALEENFEKRLVESNRRREGPILRYDQWFYWVDRAGLEPELAGASVAAYQEARYTGEADLAPQFEIARSLLDLYRRGEMPASKVFDLKRMAALFALSDLTGYYHAVHIDNLKFYYNPVTSLIEPIGYDFGIIAPLSARQGVLGEQLLPTLDNRDPMDWRTGLFLEPEFVQFYIEYLQKLSEPKFLDDFFAKIEDDYDRALSILHSSYPYYTFTGKPVLYHNQGYLRRLLSPERMLQTYFRQVDSTARTVTLEIQNIFAFPAEILSLSVGDTLRLDPVSKTVIPPYSRAEPIRYQQVVFPLPEGLDVSKFNPDELKLTHRIPGTNGLLVAQVYPWEPINEDIVAADFMRRPANIEEFDWLNIDTTAKIITIPPGTWTISHSLILPAGFIVRAGEGTSLDLTNGAMILSYSPLDWSGSEESPVRILSSDSSGEGLVVMTARAQSTLRYVEFNGLTNPTQGAWTLTGAVTFYESPATMSFCRFAANRSEDGLNMIRSEFTIEHSAFVDTQSDAFDSDFSNGALRDVAFLRCGNDGVDISGSVVTIDNVSVDGAGDKGLSAGEGSHMSALNCSILNSEIALAGKDRSVVEARNLVIHDCRVGLTAYVKKPEFSYGRIYVEGLQMSGTEVPYLVERGSSLTIDGKVIQPDREHVESILYGVEYGKASK